MLCKKETENAYSFDMDLPTVPACNFTCVYTWFHIELSKKKEKRDEERHSLPKVDPR